MSQFQPPSDFSKISKSESGGGGGGGDGYKTLILRGTRELGWVQKDECFFRFGLVFFMNLSISVFWSMVCIKYTNISNFERRQQ